MLLEISGDITPERMKRWSQSTNNTQLWMLLVMEVKSDAITSIGTWNVRSINQDKLEVLKQEMARVNINILGSGDLKQTGTGEFKSENCYIYYYRQESLRRNEKAIIVNERVWNAVLGCNLKNNRMISVHFLSKLFNVRAIQIYGLTSNAEEAEVEQFNEDLQDLLQLTHTKRCPFH